MDNGFIEKVERVVNDFGAELTALKMVLQHLVAAMLVANPMYSEEHLESLRRDVIAALSRSPGLSKSDEDKRVVELSVQHGERFFRELATAVSAMRNRVGQSGRH
jgi:hypothetical protein